MIRKQWASSCFITSLAFVCGSDTVASSAPLSLNLRSSTLSRLLTGGESTQRREPQSTENERKEPSSARNDLSNLISLGLAGEYECLVTGPSLDDDQTTIKKEPTPLFAIEKQPSFPKATVGFRYNLAKLATNPIPAVLCGVRREIWKNSAFLRVALEKNMGDKRNDVEATVTVSNSAADRALALQYDSEGKSTLHLRLPIVRHRLNLQLRTSFLPEASRDDAVGFLNSRIPPQVTSGDNDGWWIPDVELSPIGLATARSEGSHGGLGFRLMVRRPIGWSLFSGGDSFSADRSFEDDETTVRLEFQRLGRAGQRLSTLRLQAVLEEIVQSAQCTLIHERVSAW